MRCQIFALMGVAIWFVGCSTMNENECQAADWNALGYVDGGRGQDDKQYALRQKACAKHGVTADTASYRDGYRKGILTYCTREQGYELGNSGRSYPKVCPEETTGEVRIGYIAGRDNHAKKQKLRREIKSYEVKVDNADQKMTDLRYQIQEHRDYLLTAKDARENGHARTFERLFLHTQEAKIREMIQLKQYRIARIGENKQRDLESIERLNGMIRDLDRRPLFSLE